MGCSTSNTNSSKNYNNNNQQKQETSVQRNEIPNTPVKENNYILADPTTPHNKLGTYISDSSNTIRSPKIHPETCTPNENNKLNRTIESSLSPRLTIHQSSIQLETINTTGEIQVQPQSSHNTPPSQTSVLAQLLELSTEENKTPAEKLHEDNLLFSQPNYRIASVTSSNTNASIEYPSNPSSQLNSSNYRVTILKPKPRFAGGTARNSITSTSFTTHSNLSTPVSSPATPTRGLPPRAQTIPILPQNPPLPDINNKSIHPVGEFNLPAQALVKTTSNSGTIDLHHKPIQLQQHPIVLPSNNTSPSNSNTSITIDPSHNSNSSCLITPYSNIREQSNSQLCIYPPTSSDPSASILAAQLELMKQPSATKKLAK